MKMYFFDRVSQRNSQYDYGGCEFPTPEKAIELGELIALDLAVRGEGEWSGWTINVFNACGQQFSAIPVEEPDYDPDLRLIEEAGN